MGIISGHDMQAQHALQAKLAHWIATESYELPEILSKLGISEEFFDYIASSPTFQAQLGRERDNWNEPGNVSERVKSKAGVIMEKWLIEAYGRMNDPKEPLSAKTELAKLITRLAGMGVDKVALNGVDHDKFVVNINLGTDKLRYEKVVEHVNTAIPDAGA